MLCLCEPKQSYEGSQIDKKAGTVFSVYMSKYCHKSNVTGLRHVYLDLFYNYQLCYTLVYYCVHKTWAGSIKKNHIASYLPTEVAPGLLAHHTSRGPQPLPHTSQTSLYDSATHLTLGGKVTFVLISIDMLVFAPQGQYLQTGVSVHAACQTKEIFPFTCHVSGVPLTPSGYELQGLKHDQVDELLAFYALVHAHPYLYTLGLALKNWCMGVYCFPDQGDIPLHLPGEWGTPNTNTQEAADSYSFYSFLLILCTCPRHPVPPVSQKFQKIQHFVALVQDYAAKTGPIWIHRSIIKDALVHKDALVRMHLSIAITVCIFMHLPRMHLTAQERCTGPKRCSTCPELCTCPPKDALVHPDKCILAVKDALRRDQKGTIKRSPTPSTLRGKQ